MSVSFGRTPAALFQGESAAIDTTSAPTKNRDEELPDQSSIWTMIQSQKPTTPNVAAAPYVHPLVRRSVSLMSKSSLEICTESLGSETGSGDFSAVVWLNSSSDEQVIVEHKKRHQQQVGGGEDDGNQIMSVNYHHSASQRSHTPRSFPPTIPSISCREGTCIQMRTRRQDGRLVVDAIPVASQKNLHTRRHGGRLHLSFIDSTATTQTTADKTQESLINKGDQSLNQVAPQSKEINQSKEIAEDEDEDEEEVEVLDRGTMVEVKVSTQNQQPGSAKKVLRSSLVINKFVGGTPLTNKNRWAEPAEENHQSDPLAAWQLSLPPQRRLTTTTTTAAAAAVAASSASTSSMMVGQKLPLTDNKLLFTFKRRNREEILNHMRQCSELRQPLFFWEIGSIATSS